ncbi:MAG: AI-2E family transporter [Actinomycetes bacterium]
MSAPTNFRIQHAFQFGLLGGLGVLTAVALGNAAISLAGIITSIITALFLTLGLEPLIQVIQKRVKKRSYSISIVVLGILAVVATMILVIFPPLVTQTSALIVQLPNLLTDFLNLPGVQSADANLGGALSSALNTTGAYLVDSKNWPNLLGGVVQVGMTLFNGAIGAMTVFILTLYFMAALPSIKKVGISLVSKSKRERVAGLVDQVINSIGRYVMGQVLVATINASVVFTTMLIAGVEFSLVLAFVDFLLVLVPIIGAMAGWTIVVLVTLASKSVMVAAIVAAVLAVYLQVEAYIIGPKIMTKTVNVPGSLIVVAALAGGSLLGILGSLLAIPMAATLLLIIREVWVPKQELK